MDLEVKVKLVHIRALALDIVSERKLPRPLRKFQLRSGLYTVADLAARYALESSSVYAGLQARSPLLPRPTRQSPYAVRRKFLFTAHAVRRCDWVRAKFYSGVRGEDPALYGPL